LSLTQARRKRVADNGFRLFLTLGFLSTSGVGLADEVTTEQTVTFNIPQQRADLALTEFAEQADLTLIFPPELVGDLSANELIGEYTQEEGAKILLAGTGLIPTFSNRVVLSIATDGKSAPGGDGMDVKSKAGLGAILAAVFSVGAGAQEPAASATNGAGEEGNAEDEDVLETITVIGIRQQLQQSSALERAADNIVSVITADDFGDFPDETLAESIGRLSGVTVIEQEGEGRFIRIRGLSSDFAQVTLNNAQLGSSSANGDRSVALDVIPADLLSRAEVGKTLFPDTDHDSLGAKLDMRPLSAFDRRGDLTGKLTFQGNYRQDADSVDPQIISDITKRFDTNIGEFGAALGVFYSSRTVHGDRLRSQSGAGISGEDSDLVDGLTIFAPSEIDTRIERGERERVGATAVFDWDADQFGKYQLSFVYGSLDDDDRRIGQEVELRDANSGEIEITEPGMGRFSDIDIERQVFFLPSEETTYAVHFEGENQFGADEEWTLSYDVDFSRNDFEIERGGRAQWQLNSADRNDSIVDAVWGQDFADFVYVGSGDLDGSFDLSFRPTQDDFQLTQLLVLEEDRHDEVSSINADLERNFVAFNREMTIKGGFKFRNRERVFERGELVESFNSDDRAAFAAAGLPVTLGDYPLQFTGSSLPNTGGVDALLGFPEFGFSNAFIDQLIDITGVQPTDQRVDYSAEEETRAAYLMASFNLTPRLRVVTGVRFEQTIYDATGLTRQNAEISDLAGLTPDGEPIENEIVFGRAVTGEANAIETFRNEYEEFFPALHLRYDLTDEVVMRFGLSRAQVRPSFGDANALTENVYRFDTQAWAQADDGPGACQETISVPIDGENRDLCSDYLIESRGGNPDLQPLIADQVDFNVGWYPNESSNITVALYYKDLQDVFIQVNTDNPDIIAQISATDATDPLTGLPVTNLQQVINASDGELYGIELAGSHFTDYLPGFLGNLFVDGNVSFIEGSTSSFAVRGGEEFELPDQPEVIGNLGLGYEDEDITFRLTLNYREELLDQVDADNPNRDIFSAERFRLGATFRYNFNDDLRLFAAVSNLTDEQSERFYRSDEFSGPIFEQVEQFGRTWRLGVRARF